MSYRLLDRNEIVAVDLHQRPAAAVQFSAFREIGSRMTMYAIALRTGDQECGLKVCRQYEVDLH